MRISDGSSDVCASDLKSVSTGCVKLRPSSLETSSVLPAPTNTTLPLASTLPPNSDEPVGTLLSRSEEHTSELQSLMRISYAVFCLKKKIKKNNKKTIN